MPGRRGGDPKPMKTLPPACLRIATATIDRRFIVAEEKMMAQTFGDAYAEYTRGVRRWL